MDVLSRLSRSCFAVDESRRARVVVRGKDAAAFLHRLNTQHTSQLVSGNACLSVFCDAKGRIIELVHHVVLADGILLVGTRERGALLRDWLDRYLFSEQVELDDQSGKGTCTALFGGTAVDVVERLLHGARDLALWGAVARAGAVVIRTFDRVDDKGAHHPSFLIWQDVAEPLGSDVEQLPADVDDAVRIAAGVPGPAELSDAFNPLDVGLHDAIHWAKGCYIGQEVIARLDTYQKQNKRLVVVYGDPAQLAVGDDVVVGGAVVGTLTSVAPCVLVGGAAALAICRLPADVVQAEVRHGDDAVAVRLAPSPTAQTPHA